MCSVSDVLYDPVQNVFKPFLAHCDDSDVDNVDFGVSTHLLLSLGLSFVALATESGYIADTCQENC